MKKAKENWKAVSLQVERHSALLRHVHYIK